MVKASGCEVELLGPQPLELPGPARRSPTAAAPTPCVLMAPVPTSGPAFPSDPAGDGSTTSASRATGMTGSTESDEKVNYVTPEQDLGYVASSTNLVP